MNKFYFKIRNNILAMSFFITITISAYFFNYYYAASFTGVVALLFLFRLGLCVNDYIVSKVLWMIDL